MNYKPPSSGWKGVSQGLECSEISYREGKLARGHLAQSWGAGGEPSVSGALAGVSAHRAGVGAERPMGNGPWASAE